VSAGQAVGAAAANGAMDEVDAQGGFSSDMDATAIASAAGTAAAAAACAATGAGAVVAPLCGIIGGAVAGFIVDKVGPAIADFFGGLFGRAKAEPPSYIEPPPGAAVRVMWEGLGNQGAQSTYFELEIDELLRLAHNLELPGQWNTAIILMLLQENGAGLVPRGNVQIRNVSVAGTAQICVGRMAPDDPCPSWETKIVTGGDSYVGTPTLWIPDFREEYIYANAYTGGASDVPEAPVPVRRDLIDTFTRHHVAPFWRNLFEHAIPATAIAIQDKAITIGALQAAQAAISAEFAALSPADAQALRDYAQLQQIAAMTPEAQQQLRELADWQAIAAMTPAQREELRQYAELAAMTPGEREAVKAYGELLEPEAFGRHGAAVAAPLAVGGM
jgi:hypothetical protein